MRDVLFEYELNPTTWVYLSSLLVIGIFFKFNRLWSVRNLDLIGLIAFAPGLLLVTHQHEPQGYAWLFAVGGIFLLRLLLDPVMVRRPLLEPNLTVGGLTFAAVCLLVFLLSNVATNRPTEDDLQGARRLEQILARQEAPGGTSDLARHGPGYPLFYLFASFANKAFLPLPAETADTEAARRAMIEDATARTTAILGHLALIAGMVVVGYRHFGNIQTAMAAATLYLLMPYTAQMTSRVDHVIPAALLVWAVAAYRRPVISGVLVGLSAGVIYYPLFLLPLWCSFYWRRGRWRFVGGVAGVLLLLVLSLVFNVRLDHADARRAERFLGLSRQGLPHSRDGGLRGHVCQSGHLAGAKEPGHADQLFGRGDAGHTVLARAPRRHLYGMVSAAVDPDHLPAQPGRPPGRQRRSGAALAPQAQDSRRECLCAGRLSLRSAGHHTLVRPRRGSFAQCSKLSAGGSQEGCLSAGIHRPEDILPAQAPRASQASWTAGLSRGGCPHRPGVSGWHTSTSRHARQS